MKEYPNGGLLITPEQLSSELAGGQPPLVLDLRPPMRTSPVMFRARSISTCGA